MLSTKFLNASDAKRYETHLETIYRLFISHNICADCINMLFLPKYYNIVFRNKQTQEIAYTYMSFFLETIGILINESLYFESTNQWRLVEAMKIGDKQGKSSFCHYKHDCDKKTIVFKQCYRIAILLLTRMVSQRYIIKYIISNMRWFNIFLTAWFQSSMTLFSLIQLDMLHDSKESDANISKHHTYWVQLRKSLANSNAINPTHAILRNNINNGIDNDDSSFKSKSNVISFATEFCSLLFENVTRMYQTTDIKISK